MTPRNSNVKEFICKNPGSKFKHILNKDIISGKISIGFVFKSECEVAFWPLNASLYELILDGWEQV